MAYKQPAIAFGLENGTSSSRVVITLLTERSGSRDKRDGERQRPTYAQNTLWDSAQFRIERVSTQRIPLDTSVGHPGTFLGIYLYPDQGLSGQESHHSLAMADFEASGAQRILPFRDWIHRFLFQAETATRRAWKRLVRVQGVVSRVRGLIAWPARRR